MDKELEDLVAIIETIEYTDDNAYMKSIKEEGNPVGALQDMQILRKSVIEILDDCADDVKEIDRYRIYKRYSRCIARELVLIQKVVDSMEVARV